MCTSTCNMQHSYRQTGYILRKKGKSQYRNHNYYVEIIIVSFNLFVPHLALSLLFWLNLLLYTICITLFLLSSSNRKKQEKPSPSWMKIYNQKTSPAPISSTSLKTNFFETSQPLKHILPNNKKQQVSNLLEQDIPYIERFNQTLQIFKNALKIHIFQNVIQFLFNIVCTDLFIRSH